MKRNYYKNILSVLTQLHKDHPTYEFGNHLATALSEYKDIWGVPDKEILAALRKYQAVLSQDQSDITDEYIDQIVKDGMSLGTILDENEEDEI